MNEDAGRRRRAGGRAGNKQRAGTAVIDQMPWRIPVNPDRPTDPLDMDGVMAAYCDDIVAAIAAGLIRHLTINY